MEHTIPKHIAFIMDGNGRWAKKRLLPRAAGHREGVKALKRVINGCIANGIQFVTLYTFSTENWKRPQNEVDSLMNLIREFLDIEVMTEFDKPVRIRIIGDMARMPEDIATSVKAIEEKSKNINGLCVVIALNYGSRAEIINAINLAIDSGAKITEDNFASYLYTNDIPDPDLIVRTGGEQRLSNYLLYQSAYAELMFIEKLWPDMKEKDIIELVTEYSKRDRRYGAVK